MREEKRDGSLTLAYCYAPLEGRSVESSWKKEGSVTGKETSPSTGVAILRRRDSKRTCAVTLLLHEIRVLALVQHQMDFFPMRHLSRKRLPVWPAPMLK